MGFYVEAACVRLITEAMRQELVDLEIQYGKCNYVDPFVGVVVYNPTRVREVETEWRRLLEKRYAETEVEKKRRDCD